MRFTGCLVSLLALASSSEAARRNARRQGTEASSSVGCDTGSGFFSGGWCGSSPQNCGQCGGTWGDLEACLKGPGGSPWTYVGEDQYQGQDNLKGIHNARVSDSIKPSAIVFVKEASHVTYAVSCAYQFQVPVYGRSGMNQYEASCTDDTGAGCVIIDTNNLDQFAWARDGCQNGAAGCFVEMGPGVSLGTAYTKLSKRNYTIPGGSCAQVRVAGLTLGGGKGWLSRKHGIMSDTLVSITAVLLNGTQVHASAAVHAHLFWLARGGGGAIFPGVVTALSFAVVPMPQSFAIYTMKWDLDFLNTECRVKVMTNWYDQLATDSDNDVWSGMTLRTGNKTDELTFSDSGAYQQRTGVGVDEETVRQLVIDVMYYGNKDGIKDGMEQRLRNLSPLGCSVGEVGNETNPNISWIDMVKSGNAGDNCDPQGKCNLEGLNNNCGWLLQDGQKPTHTDCIGPNQKYDVQLAYRSLIIGKGSAVPQGVWNTLAQLDVSRIGIWINFTPTNGVTAEMPSNATAYPHRDAGYVTMQQVMISETLADVNEQMLESATMMTRLTAEVPLAGYYNYLDKNMNQYGGTPREAYYGTNADRVDTYLREYTIGVNPNRCERCDSWELRGGTVELAV